MALAAFAFPRERTAGCEPTVTTNNGKMPPRKAAQVLPSGPSGEQMTVLTLFLAQLHLVSSDIWLTGVRMLLYNRFPDQRKLLSSLEDPCLFVFTVCSSH